MFENFLNGIHSINVPFTGNYYILSEQSLIGIVVLAVVAILAIALICKCLGAIGRAIFRK